MKLATAIIATALCSTSAHAWGDREQGTLAGIVGTILVQQIYRDSQDRSPREQPQVVVRERPAPVIVYRQNPPIVIQDTAQILCPQGTAEFYVQRYDRYGRPFYLFDGCR